MRKLFTTGIAAALLAFASAAHAAEGPLMVRVRGIAIVPADKSDAIPALGVPSDEIDISNQIVPELDFSWFFTPNLSAELVLAVAKHDVEVAGTDIGDFTHIPPTLLVQWHFLPDFVVNPYVGAGVNLTWIADTNLEVPGVSELELDTVSLGLAGQVGADIKVADHWYLNADVKYVTIRSDVELKGDGTKVSAVQVDPWIFGLGVGYRF